MKLVYKAVTKDGKTIKGFLEAKDIKEAVVYLRGKELVLVDIKTEQSAYFTRFAIFHKIGSSDIVFFTRQLSSMISAGLTIMQAMVILKDQVENDALKEVISGIITKIEEGKSFSLAITDYPKVFSPIYISLIKSAESSGLLDKVLLRLSENLEKQEKLKSTIKGALMYPAIVITGMVLVMTVMMIFVIPQLSTLYQNLNIPLPLPTQIIIGLSNFTITFWPLILGVIALLFIFYNRWRKTETGNLIIDDLMLRLPIFGKLIKEKILTEFTRTLGLLVGSGTLVVEAMKQSSNVVGNVLYKNAIDNVALGVEKGLTISDSMSASSLFPPILVQMARIGEETGKLDESLLNVSGYFEREVDQTVKTLTTAMEPFIMIVLGLGVAFLIISIITPIYNLTSSM